MLEWLDNTTITNVIGAMAVMILMVSCIILALIDSNERAAAPLPREQPHKKLTTTSLSARGDRVKGRRSDG